MKAAGGATIGERAAANRRRVAWLTTVLTLMVVLAAVALSVPLIFITAILTGGEALPWIPPFFAVAAVLGVVAVAVMVLLEQRRSRAHEVPDGLTSPTADDARAAAASLADVAMAAGLSTAPPLYVDTQAQAPNAYAYGHDPTDAYVVVSQPLLDLLDRRELKGVLAHEVAHIKSEDVRVSSRAISLAGLVSRFRYILFFPTRRLTLRTAVWTSLPLAVWVILEVLVKVRFDSLGDGAGEPLRALVERIVLILVGLILLPAGAFAALYARLVLLRALIVLSTSLLLPGGILLSSPLVARVASTAVSRVREYQADADGASFTGEPLALASALRRLEGIPNPEIVAALGDVRMALFIVPENPSSRLRVAADRLFASHPPMARRIEALDRLGGLDTTLAMKASSEPPYEGTNT